MHVFTMVVWIVGLCVAGRIIMKMLSDDRVKPTDNNNDMERLIEINEELNNKVKALEARVISLEAIVTDEGYELKHKISGL